MLDPVAQLLANLRKGGEWPPKAHAAVWRQVKRWRAFADGDRDELARIAGWPKARRYRVDDLGGRIREAWADHLFGDPLDVKPAGERDQELLEQILEENDFTQECRAAESDTVIPEGEAWWRVYVDADVADVPLFEFYSRLDVAPLFLGKKTPAVALITVLEGKPNVTAADNAVFRHLEIHADARVVHVLHRGTSARLGQPVELDAHPELEDLAEDLDATDEYAGPAGVWNHGLPMLMGRIINKRGRNPRLGVSEFSTIEDQLLDLNEAASIAAGNVKLTARKRVAVPASAVRAGAPGPSAGMDLVDQGDGMLTRADGQPLNAPVFDADEDVLINEPLNEELGRDGPSPFQVLEYSFDAEPLIKHKRDLVETALTRIGLAPEWVGVNSGDSRGLALSGTARRLILHPTTKAANGKAKPWDTALPRIVALMLLLADLEEGQGGLGAGVEDPSPPAITRADPLPDDPVEESMVESTLVTAGVRSRKTSIRSQHPDWDETQVEEELELIAGDAPAAPAGPGFGFGGGPA